jgi:hypothetical protein
LEKLFGISEKKGKKGNFRNPTFPKKMRNLGNQRKMSNFC